MNASQRRVPLQEAVVPPDALAVVAFWRRPARTSGSRAMPTSTGAFASASLSSTSARRAANSRGGPTRRKARSR